MEEDKRKIVEALQVAQQFAKMVESIVGPAPTSNEEVTTEQGITAGDGETTK